MPTLPLVLPDGLPFLLPGGPLTCLLFHGFTAMPAEMRWLGDDLHARGHSVLGVRLAGHGTHPADLARTRWSDWLVDVEEGLALARGLGQQAVLIGQSMGGLVALLGAGTYPDQAAGVVAIAAPFDVTLPSRDDLRALPAGQIQRKNVPMHHEYGVRREAVYPAYAAEAPHVLPELADALQAMRAALPAVQAPALLIHSADDPAVPFDSMDQIYQRLGSASKHRLRLDGLGHSVVRHPRRRPVFEVIGRFVASIAGGDEFDLTGDLLRE